VQDLDDRLAAEQRLLAAVHGAESAFVDTLTKDELANHPSAEIFVFPQPIHTLSPTCGIDHPTIVGFVRSKKHARRYIDLMWAGVSVA
jgi:hypothetical protein